MPELIFINQTINYLFYDIITYFSNDNIKISIVSGNEYILSSKKATNIKRYKLQRYIRNSLLKRSLTWLIFIFQLFFLLITKAKKKNELFISTNPPFAPFLGLFFYKFFKINYYLIIYDIYPNALLLFDKFTESSFIFRLWQKLNNSIYKHANLIYTISQEMANELSEYTDINKVKVIYNWSNSKTVKPILKKQNWFAKKYNQINKTTVMYSGNFGSSHSLEPIISTASLLIAYENINFMLIGDGAQKNKIKTIVDNHNLSNILLLPFQSEKDFTYSISIADVGIITQHGLFSAPSKLYNFLAIGAAIIGICSDDSDLAKIIKTYNCGAVFNITMSAEIANFVRLLHLNKTKLNFYKKNSFEASSHFTNKNAELYFSYYKKHKSNN